MGVAKNRENPVVNFFVRDNLSLLLKCCEVDEYSRHTVHVVVKKMLKYTQLCVKFHYFSRDSTPGPRNEEGDALPEISPTPPPLCILQLLLNGRKYACQSRKSYTHHYP